jgi:hypothetical protein
MPAALKEILRVCRPCGRCKIMAYNRHSLVSYLLWVKRALLRGRPEIWVRASAVNVVINLAANLVLIPRFGVTGAALASSVSCWAVTVVVLVSFGRLTGLSGKEYLRPRISEYRTL